MTQYEQILSKISPIFFKIEQYRDYYKKNFYLLQSYLPKAKFPIIYNVDILGASKNVYYYYDAGLYKFEELSTNIEIITLATRNNVSIYTASRLDEFIINMVINDFSFENEPIYDEYLKSVVDFKTLFIALVGKDMYDTIRENIK